MFKTVKLKLKNFVALVDKKLNRDIIGEVREELIREIQAEIKATNERIKQNERINNNAKTNSSSTNRNADKTNAERGKKLEKELEIIEELHIVGLLNDEQYQAKKKEVEEKLAVKDVTPQSEDNVIIDLNKINLPLSEDDYKKLLDWRDNGLISWLDFPDKLSKGLKEYDKTHKGAEWELISETPTD